MTMRKIVGIFVRLIVLMVTIGLLLQSIRRGGWWIAAMICWLPVNALVVGYFDDATSDDGGMSEASILGD